MYTGLQQKDLNKHVSSIWIDFLEGKFCENIKSLALVENIDWRQYFYTLKSHLMSKME